MWLKRAAIPFPERSADVDDVYARLRRDAEKTIDSRGLGGIYIQSSVVLELLAMREEFAAAREALGVAWLVGGVSLADGIRRKTAALEKLVPARARRCVPKDLPDVATMSLEDLRAEVEGGREAFAVVADDVRRLRDRIRKIESARGWPR